MQLAINPEGFKQDGSYRQGEPFSFDWDADGEWAATVDADRWSAEVMLRFSDQMPRPEPGEMWSGNFVRCFRGQEFLQWTRTTFNSVRPDQYGVLVFR